MGTESRRGPTTTAIIQQQQQQHHRNNKHKKRNMRLGGAIPSPCQQLLTTIGLLWKSPIVRFLGVYQMAFGIGQTFGDMYLNGYIVKESLGMANVGWMAAITPSVAALISPVFSYFGASEKGKRSEILLGSSFYAAVGSIAIALSPGALRNLKWGIASLYVCLGVCRGVFETPQKAAIVDFFPGERARYHLR
eukprot:jgi/Bigna1/77679/fgenesh1_pg.49_\